LDDGCYKSERVSGKLSNEEIKFPGGFKELSDYIHSKGLKYGMYNDIGTNLCAGAKVGTCGFEDIDARSYIDWNVDFLKVDNCYYPFDNATFSSAENAGFVYTPCIRAVKIGNRIINAVSEGLIIGDLAKTTGDYVSFIGTIDGTGPEASPVGIRSSELVFEYCSEAETTFDFSFEYLAGREEGIGFWLQIAVGDDIVYDSPVSENGLDSSFHWSDVISLQLKEGVNKIRLMNHRRQENVLNSYARLLKELKKIAPDRDIYYSACEWGKTQPQNWAYKVCDSWRILNDITFRVGSDGDNGHGDWISDYTAGVTSQYNKCVIMDEFAGLGRGWNDPDLLMIGMAGLNLTQCKTHMAMWCMMNSPLMLSLDLRRVEKGDDIYKIIANKMLIAINQDDLGIQAKRVYSSLAKDEPAKEYIRDTDRVDILAKPMIDDQIAISFINVSDSDKDGKYSISFEKIKEIYANSGLEPPYIRNKYIATDVYTGEQVMVSNGEIQIDGLFACDNKTFILRPYEE
ncbi:MAG: alpha-galactosidase, partial [Lachnospiraceae bacterium]|nr:alpha-galactosidase [Lachnospiraceae bacterium]